MSLPAPIPTPGRAGAVLGGLLLSLLAAAASAEERSPRVPRAEPWASAQAGEEPGTSPGAGDEQRVPPEEPFNVLLFVLDDLGVEQLSLYSELNAWEGDYPYASTPNIDRFAAEGVTFTSFYAAPVCSPFRASVLTGQRVHKHRLGGAVNAGSPAHLGDVEGQLLTTLLARSPVPVELGLRGKWHLGPGDEDPSHPHSVGGFTTYGGKLENPGMGPVIGRRHQSWRTFRYTDIGASGEVTQFDMEGGMHLQVAEYQATRAFTAAHAERSSTFFLFSSFHFAHGPFSRSWIDPEEVDPVTDRPFHGYGPEPPEGELEVVQVVRMMTESCDTMIGGVFSQLSPEQRARTVVIICADNGTDGVAIDPELSPSLGPLIGAYQCRRFKHTAYQGGVRVPLVIWGGAETGIGSGVVSDALCEAPDLYVTIAEAFGLLEHVEPEIDGVSLWPILRGEPAEVRSHAFSQRHWPNGAGASDYTDHVSAVVNQARWKLIDHNGDEELYDLSSDPFELRDRMRTPGESRLQYLDLRAELDRIRAQAP